MRKDPERTLGQTRTLVVKFIVQCPNSLSQSALIKLFLNKIGVLINSDLLSAARQDSAATWILPLSG